MHLKLDFSSFWGLTTNLKILSWSKILLELGDRGARSWKSSENPGFPLQFPIVNYNGNLRKSLLFQLPALLSPSSSNIFDQDKFFKLVVRPQKLEKSSFKCIRPLRSKPRNFWFMYPPLRAFLKLPSSYYLIVSCNILRHQRISTLFKQVRVTREK